MKKFLFLLFVLGGIGYWYKQHHAADESTDPETIANPVYAHVKVNIQFGKRAFDQVMLVAAADEAECAKVQGRVENLYGASAAKAGQDWTIKSSECKTDIEPRYAKTFENRPTYVTYLSMSRGNRDEREIRIVTWDITVEESNQLCESMARGMRKKWKGTVACIRAQST